MFSSKLLLHQVINIFIYTFLIFMFHQIRQLPLRIADKGYLVVLLRIATKTDEKTNIKRKKILFNNR